MNDGLHHFRHPQAIQDEDDSILPLINVVFLLLIFFMITGSLAQVDPFEIDPPQSDAPAAQTEEPLVLHVSADGRLALGGQAVPMAELSAALRTAAGGETPAALRLKADARAEATQIVAIMEQLRSAGVKTVRLLTVQRGT